MDKRYLMSFEDQTAALDYINGDTTLVSPLVSLVGADEVVYSKEIPHEKKIRFVKDETTGKLYIDVVRPADNEIWYTSSNGKVVTPYKTDAFGANIVSNEYKDGQGVITFDRPVSSIKAVAFQGCRSLTSITIPNSVTSINGSAFQWCDALTSMMVESGNTKYDSRDNCNAIIETATNTLVAGCKKTIIPESVTSIGNRAFYRCSVLTSFNIPNSVTSIGNSAFYGCHSMKSVTIGNSVNSIGEEAFYACEVLTSVIIPNSVTTIGRSAFSQCQKLAYITIGNSVTSIGSNAFFYCKVYAITIPHSVNSIGANAFSGCQSLRTITFEGTMDEWNNITKGSDWDKWVPAGYVQCSDGQVAL